MQNTVAKRLRCCQRTRVNWTTEDIRYCFGFVAVASAFALGCTQPNYTTDRMTEAKVRILLAETDDFVLSDGVYCAAADLTNNRVDFESENEPLRTVSMVWLASGVVDNGGFQYLLEYECGNDRELHLIADAFRRIEAKRCAQAFDELFAMFPDAAVIDDYDAKLAYYQSVPEETKNRVDAAFYSQSESIPKLMAKFIRENRDGVLRELTRQK